MQTDILIIGAGLAGLACALECAGVAVVLVNDTQPQTDVASAWAQGGVAAALGADDTPELHAADTSAAAAGIADAAVVRDLTAAAPSAIAALEGWGVPFDRSADGSLALGLEAAHSRRRIVHAADHTGSTIVRSLLAAIAARPRISLLTGLRATDLLRADDGRVRGALFVDARGERVRIEARAVVLASGGYGGLYAKTTTPAATLGAGLAMAARVGATLADLEFVQFHPTALAVGRPATSGAPAGPLALVSEAVRGEGATLIDERGERFTDELGARDVVARAIFGLEERGGRAFLDARAALGKRFAGRFPSIAARCAEAGLDPAVDPIPVTPAAHYTIGGIATDGRGRTDVPGLWACGEVAATGLHGANRLASNSLLEALLVGARAARDICGRPFGPDAVVRGPAARALDVVDDIAAALGPLRATMSLCAGVVRDEPGLQRALAACERYAGEAAATDPRVADAIAVARSVATAALARRESRGAHFRRDCPLPDARFSARSFVASAPRSPIAMVS